MQTAESGVPIFYLLVVVLSSSNLWTPPPARHCQVPCFLGFTMKTLSRDYKLGVAEKRLEPKEASCKLKFLQRFAIYI